MRMKRILTFLFPALLGLSLSSCSKFLDILPPSTSINPTKIKDFQEMLNNDSLANVPFFMLDLMTDDVQMTDAHYDIGDNYLRRTYLWETKIWNPAQDDMMYNSAYRRILQMNIILDKVNGAPADESNTPANKSNVISQALINRAWFYLQLVNIYGLAYDEVTAGTDPAVPLILVPNSYALQSRASVAEVYSSVITDLKRAVANTYLPSKGVDIIHPGKAAGYALLARAFLYKQDYAAAKNYADSALALEQTLVNNNTTAYQPAQLLDLVPNKEILLGRMTTEENFYTLYNGFMIGRSLRDSMGTTDRRYVNRFTSDVYKLNTVNSRVMTFDNSVAVPEVMLIKAECLARAGDVTGSAAVLTTLRTNRLPAASVSNRTYTAANILNYVLGERRRELCYRGGLRLFDLKRLNKDERFKRDLVRLNGNGQVLTTSVIRATIPAGSGRYLLPFSPAVIAANPNVKQNPRL